MIAIITIAVIMKTTKAQKPAVGPSGQCRRIPRGTDNYSQDSNICRPEKPKS
jgi:hypothetical protein